MQLKSRKRIPANRTNATMNNFSLCIKFFMQPNDVIYWRSMIRFNGLIEWHIPIYYTYPHLLIGNSILRGCVIKLSSEHWIIKFKLGWPYNYSKKRHNKVRLVGINLWAHIPSNNANLEQDHHPLSPRRPSLTTDNGFPITAATTTARDKPEFEILVMDGGSVIHFVGWWR